MEMNARNDVVTSPLNGRGRSLAAQQIAHAVVTEAHNKSVANTRLLTVEEVAELLSVPRSWVYGRATARDRDRLPGMRLGKMGPVADYYVQEMANRILRAKDVEGGKPN